MYFTGDDGYQNFLDFAPMLSSLVIEKLLNVYRSEYNLKKIERFDTSPESAMSNSATSRI